MMMGRWVAITCPLMVRVGGRKKTHQHCFCLCFHFAGRLSCRRCVLGEVRMFFKAARALACGVLFVLVCGDMDSSGELQEKTKAGKEGRREREGGDAHISIDMISTRHIFTIWPLFNIDSGACVLDIYLPLGQLISHFFPIILRIRTCV